MLKKRKVLLLIMTNCKKTDFPFFIFSVTLQIDIFKFKSSLSPLLGCTYCLELEWHSDSVSGSSFSLFDFETDFEENSEAFFPHFKIWHFALCTMSQKQKKEETGELSIRGWCGHKMCFRFTAIKLEGKLHCYMRFIGFTDTKQQLSKHSPKMNKWNEAIIYDTKIGNDRQTHTGFYQSLKESIWCYSWNATLVIRDSNARKQ